MGKLCILQVEKLCISEVGLEARNNKNQTPQSGKLLLFLKLTLAKKRKLIPPLDKNFTSYAKNYYSYKNLCLMPKNTVLTLFTLNRTHALIIFRKGVNCAFR